MGNWFSFEYKLDQQTLQKQLQSKRALVVGGTAGIGLALARSMAKRGCKVDIVGRRDPKISTENIQWVPCDLALMRNAQKLSQQLNLADYDYILFTVGSTTTPERQETAEGVERDMAVSYLCRYVISKSILEQSAKYTKQWRQRVFCMAVPGQKMDIDLSDFNSERAYKFWPAHTNTVVCNEALVHYLKRPHLLAYGVNPGFIQTEIRGNMLGKNSWLYTIVEALIGLLFQSTESYAEKTLIHLVVNPALDSKSGAMFGSSGEQILGNPLLTVDKINGIHQQSEKLLTKALAVKL